MLNKVILKGNIGRSPKFEKTQSGKDVGKFFLATSLSWKTEDGEWHTHTDWHRVTVLKTSTLSWMQGVLKRGDGVYVEGKLSYHKWVDKYGQERATPHVMVTNREGLIELIRSSSSSGVSDLPTPDLSILDRPKSLEEEGLAPFQDSDPPSLSQPMEENSL